MKTSSGTAASSGAETHRAASHTDVTYDTVVFDLGRVLVGWEPYLALADRMTRDEWETFSAAIDFPAVNHAMDAGLPHADAIARVAATHPEHASTLSRYCSNFAATLTGPVDGTTEIVDELATAGVRLVGLTNWSAETFHHAAESAPVIERLEDVVVSGHERVVKPDPAIFQVLVDRHGLEPQTAVFVDDSPANVAGAGSGGLHGPLFTDAGELRTGPVGTGPLGGDRAAVHQNGGPAV